MTIQRLELVGTHMVKNLDDNVVTSLGGVEIRNVSGWGATFKNNNLKFWDIWKTLGIDEVEPQHKCEW